MQKKEKFINWMGANTNLKASTIAKYSGAIDIISEELSRYGLLDGSLYNISDPVRIKTKSESYLAIPEFYEKDNRGNRMYSNALRYYILFTKSLMDKKYQEELFKEELEFENYLIEKVVDVNKVNIEDKPMDKPKHRLVNNKRVWIRNPERAREAVAYANYLCEINSKHKHFVSKFNRKNYVEAHHLIPMQYQDQFNYSLDIHANIVSICIVCHKKLHYGLLEDKKEILKTLYNKRKERLSKSGIYISIDELYNYYLD